jgi:hypothetical protein
VAACHCTKCQRRTGSPFGVGTLFPKEQVRKVYVRGSDSGQKIEISFLRRLRLLGVLARGIVPGLCRHRVWHVRRPVDAPADASGVGADAASLGNPRSHGRLRATSRSSNARSWSSTNSHLAMLPPYDRARLAPGDCWPSRQSGPYREAGDRRASTAAPAVT